jgi:hypothetical protein
VKRKSISFEDWSRVISQYLSTKQNVVVHDIRDALRMTRREPATIDDVAAMLKAAFPQPAGPYFKIKRSRLKLIDFIWFHFKNDNRLIAARHAGEGVAA